MANNSTNSSGFNILHDQLEKIRHKTVKVQNFKTQDKSNLPGLDTIGTDGVNHINIWEKASTDLGVALSHMSDLPFTHETYGKFRSIEGFWHYIRSVSRDDRTRMMAGYKAKKFGDGLQSQRVDDFKAIIMDANYQKIKQYPPLIDELRKSTLAFDFYYLYNNDVNIRIRPASAFWLIDGFEEVRKAIKENREPDFTFLKDRINRNKKPNVQPKQKERYTNAATLNPSLVQIANERKVENNISTETPVESSNPA